MRQREPLTVTGPVPSHHDDGHSSDARREAVELLACLGVHHEHTNAVGFEQVDKVRDGVEA